MVKRRSSLQTYSGWLALALVVTGLSFIGLRATATSFRLPSAPQLVPSAELRNPLTAALDLLNPIPTFSTASTATLTPSLSSPIQQLTVCGASFAEAAGSPINVGTNPRSVAVGDFNLDGKPDLAVANENSNNLTVLLGTGNGGFTQAVGSPVVAGTHPVSVAVGDFNLDGKPDLAVANLASNEVTILLGNGNGGFTQAAGSPIGSLGVPDFVVVGDFNLDGKPDLAVASYIAASVMILLGNGNGIFTPAVGAPINVGNTPVALAIGDFNSDSKPDLAVANVGTSAATNRVTILIGNGSGGFTQAAGSPIVVGNGPRSISVGDFNSDGKKDLAIANSGFANVTILLGNGSGGFTQAAGSPLSVGGLPSSIAVTDYNLDGKPDLAVANGGSDDVTILLGNGSGGFTQPSGSPVSIGDAPVFVVTGDFNLDGKPDFATTNADSNNVTVQLNTCPAQLCASIAFSQPVGSPAYSGARSLYLVAEDFNLDGKPDLAVANEGSNNVAILIGNGSGDFIQSTGSPVSVGTGPRTLAVGDFNHDGKPDIAVGNVASNNVTILLGNGMGGFTQAPGSPIGTGLTLLQVTVGDINLDGKLDLITVNINSYTIVILFGDGTGGFTQSRTLPFYSTNAPRFVSVGDFNLDGKPDLGITTGYSSGNVAIMLGDGMGNFTQAGAPIGIGQYLESMVVEDFNNDGKPDLAIVIPSTHSVAILLGNGIGGLVRIADSSVSPGTYPNSVASGDFNLDGKVDLVVVNSGSNNASILLGNGLGRFTQITGSPVGIGQVPFSIVVMDVNNDGKIDLATANRDSSDVTVLLNTCTLNTSPTVSCSTNITIGTTATQNLASVPFNITATGTPTPTVTCRVSNTVITSPHVFPVGTTTVNCTASNGVAPDASCSFTVTVNRVSGSANDPLACTGPGSKVQATLNISNDGQVNQNVVSNTTFTNLTGIPGSCAVTPNVGTCTVTSGGVSYSATLTPSQAVTITYLTQVSDLAPPGAQVCTNNSVSFNGGAPLNFSACDVVDCPAVGPGGAFPSSAEMSDQKAGSVLVYNIYTSSTDPVRQNTRINLTNAHSRLAAFVHLFFVFEGCSIADSYVCLTANQTASFLASDLDPGVTGYIVALAVDSRGCPIDFNYLIGDEYVKFASGHAANLSAEAFAALPGGLPICDGSSVTAALNFDGVSYNRAPRVLALSNVASRADGNDTMLILNRIGGNLGIGAASLGTLFGILYDDAENALSFQVSNACQLRSSLSNGFPRTAPRFETFIPAGRTGWIKVFSQPPADIGITGAAINFNPNLASSAGAFNQGHNLHALTMSAANTYTIPVFPPSC
jgi:hypothetical protein